MKLHRVVAFCGFAFAITSPLPAQTMILFPYPQSRTVIDVRLLHILPNLGASPISDGALDITAIVPVDKRINLVASLPITHDSRLIDNSVALGNIFCGVQLSADSTRQTIATIGIYFPTSSHVSSVIPLYVNRYEIQRYAANYTTVYANVAKQIIQGKEYAVHGELGTMYIAAGNRGDTSTVSLHYGLGASAGNQDLRWTFEYAGMVSISQSFLGLGNNSFVHFIGLGATLMGKHIQPGLMVELPLNRGLRNVIYGAVGISLLVKL